MVTKKDTKNKVLEIFDLYLERRIRAITCDFQNGYFKECDKNLIISELRGNTKKDRWNLLFH